MKAVRAVVMLCAGLALSTGHARADEQAQRLAHLADIAYYTTQYDGADIALARFNCGRAGGMHAAAPERAAWLACYERFVANYNAALPVGRSIPADVVDVMTDAELAAAQQRMNQVFVQIAQAARQQADAVAPAQGGWDGKAGAHDLVVGRSGGERHAQEQTSAVAPKQ
jgi:hypothetical protein